MDLMNLAHRTKPLEGKLEKVGFLIVEDEKLMQVMIRQMLRDNGASDLRCADSAGEAYRMLKARPAKVIITDWHMPRMTGIELLQAIKSDPYLFRTQVLIISSETSPLGLLLAFEEGVDGFLLKPFNEKALMQSLLKVMQKRSGSAKRKLDDIIRLKLLGRYQEAIDLGEQLLGEEDEAELHYTLAECHFQVGRYDEALKRAEAAMEKKKDGKCMSLVGKIHMEQGNFDQAIDVLQQAADKNALDVGRRLELATAFIKAGKIDKFQEVVDGLDVDKLTDANYVDLAACYLLSGDVDQAASLLKKSRDPLPQAAKVFNACGAALWKKGSREEGLKLYRRCIKLSPEYSKAHYNLGLALCFTEAYEEAKQALECAVRLKPDYKPARELLDYVKQKQGRTSLH